MATRHRAIFASAQWLLIAAAGLIVTAGCDSRGGSSASASGNPREKVTSAVLTAELNRALDEFVAKPRSFARNVEPRVYDRAKTLKEVTDGTPDFLIVTAEDESRFAQAKFDD